MSKKPDDIIIAGGGLNGLAMAVALAGSHARIPLNVTVVDAHDPKDMATSTNDGRASAITASSQRMLDVLGVWERLEPDAQPMREIVVTDSYLGEAQRPALLHFGEAASGHGPSAWMIENRHLLKVLFEMASSSEHIRFETGHAIARYDLAASAATARLENDRSLSAPLLIGCDGRNSPARQAAGLKTTGWSYDQSGIVLTVEHEKSHDGVAYEHFLPAGPFAILPLKGNRASLVWTEKTGEAERIAGLGDAAFQRELEQRFGHDLGQVRPVTKPQTFPLSVQISYDFVARRLALVGDAAHVVHPIAGLGFNLGLRDTAALTECVTDAVRLGQDHGGLDVLERYQRWRRLDTVMVAAATDGLNRLFSNDDPVLGRLRRFGLGLVNGAETVKSAFMVEAAGHSGSIPKLLQGDPV